MLNDMKQLLSATVSILDWSESKENVQRVEVRPNPNFVGKEKMSGLLSSSNSNVEIILWEAGDLDTSGGLKQYGIQPVNWKHKSKYITYTQRGSYHHCLNHGLVNKHEWVMSLDIDEYLFLSPHWFQYYSGEETSLFTQL